MGDLCFWHIDYCVEEKIVVTNLTYSINSLVGLALLVYHISSPQMQYDELRLKRIE